MLIASCSQTDTPRSDFTLSAVLQGNWLVETMDAHKDWSTLGSLAINGNRYHFYPIPGAEIPSQMRERFCFFDKPAGEIVLEYQTGISPNDDVRTFKDNESLLMPTGIGCGAKPLIEKFLIRVDQDRQELYFHALISEIPLYRIHKSYND